MQQYFSENSELLFFFLNIFLRMANKNSIDDISVSKKRPSVVVPQRPCVKKGEGVNGKIK